MDGEARGCPIRGVPQAPQNLKRGGFSNPDRAQRCWSWRGVLHSPQNFISSGLSKPQFGQRIQVSFRRRASIEHGAILPHQAGFQARQEMGLMTNRGRQNTTEGVQHGRRLRQRLRHPHIPCGCTERARWCVSRRERCWRNSMRAIPSCQQKFCLASPRRKPPHTFSRGAGTSRSPSPSRCIGQHCDEIMIDPEP